MKLKYLSVVLLTGALVGCGSLGDLAEGTTSINYRSVAGSNPLELPPDLSSRAINPKYVAEVAANESQRFLNQKSIRLEGDARSSWLEVDSSNGSKLWDVLVDFWESEGFTIKARNPEAGLIVTDWAENQAKLPVKIPLLNFLSDTSERDRFYTRIYRVNKHYRIVINYERMSEKASRKDGTGIYWGHDAQNPALNAEMLSRLMTYLGAKSQDVQSQHQARQQTLRHHVSANSAEAAQLRSHPYVESPYVHLNIKAQNTDYAWQWLGQVMTSSRFNIKKVDYNKKSYEFLYLDTDDGLVHEEANFFARLFGKKSNVTPKTYYLVVGKGEQGIEIYVVDESGQIDNSSTAKRILTVLAQAL